MIGSSIDFLVWQTVILGVAPPAGIEPATNRLEGGRSIR